MTLRDLHRDAVFRALADPTRRGILEALGERPLPVHALAQRFPMSRPAISRHLKVLGEVRLVSARREGKENLYALDRAALEDARAWLDRFWTAKLHTLKQLAERKT